MGLVVYNFSFCPTQLSSSAPNKTIFQNLTLQFCLYWHFPPQETDAPLVLSKTDSNWWKTDCLQTYSLDKIWLFSDIFWGFIAKKLTYVYGHKYKIKPRIKTTSNCTIFLGFLALFTMFALEIWLFDKNLTFIWPVWAQKSVNWFFPEKLTATSAVNLGLTNLPKRSVTVLATRATVGSSPNV